MSAFVVSSFFGGLTSLAANPVLLKAYVAFSGVGVQDVSGLTA